MTLTPTAPTDVVPPRAGLAAVDLPPLPGRTLDEPELRALVRAIGRRRDLWAAYAERSRAGRHYASLYRDADVDVWLLGWDLTDDTGWHDHDTSAGAVTVLRGAVRESRPRLGGVAEERTVRAGRTFSFGADHIHRMGGAVDGSVSIHAYSPPLWRMGQYSISDSGVMRRWSVSYADELRPIDV